MTNGQVRIRSNVIDDPRRWDLVPGEVLKQLPLQVQSRPTRRQDDEQTYYEPCSKCHRKIAIINLYGCTKPWCNAPSPAAAERARDAWRERVDSARSREAQENAAIRGSDETTSSADPFEALQ